MISLRPEEKVPGFRVRSGRSDAEAERPHPLAFGPGVIQPTGDRRLIGDPEVGRSAVVVLDLKYASPAPSSTIYGIWT